MYNASIYKSSVLDAARMNNFNGLGAPGTVALGIGGIIGIALMYGALGFPGGKPVMTAVGNVAKFRRKETGKVVAFGAGAYLLMSSLGS